LLGLPITHDGRSIGGLYLCEPRGRDRFSSADEQAAGLIAAGVAAAIRRVRLARANKIRQRWLREAADLSRELLAGEIERPLWLVADRVRSMAAAELVAVITEKPGTELFEVLEAAGARADEVRGHVLDSTTTAAGDVLAEGHPRVMDHLSRGARAYLPRVIGAETAILVPFGAPGSRRGMLTALRLPSQPPFTPTEVELTTTFATQMGLALQLVEGRAHRERAALLDERDRIARDLHDHVIQRLFAVGLAVQSVGAQMEGEPGKRLLAAVDDIDSTIAQIRSTIYRLSGPVVSAESSLRVRVARLLTELEPVLGHRVELQIRGAVDFAMEDDLAQDCLAVLREALTNVARHAQATRATVALSVGGGRLLLDVWDDGIGLGGEARRSGLANLRARAERRGGSLELSSGAVEGTRLTWTIPWTNVGAP
jgi:signal transduction histidine kinase